VSACVLLGLPQLLRQVVYFHLMLALCCPVFAIYLLLMALLLRRQVLVPFLRQFGLHDRLILLLFYLLNS